MKKKQNLIEFSRLDTKGLLKRLENLRKNLQDAKTKIITGKSSQTSAVPKFKIQIAQIKTLINQRIIQENEKNQTKKD